MKILAMYFSGTGNTKYVVEKMKASFEKLSVDLEMISIESFSDEDRVKIESADFLLFAYPVYGSMAPMIMWHFIKRIAKVIEDKKSIVIATQSSFSGDGGAYLARILRKCYAPIVSIEHFKMPSNISDSKFLGNESESAAQKKIKITEKRIELYCMDFVKDVKRKRGDGVGSILLGSVQRVPFSKWEKKLSKSVKIDSEICTKCGLCVQNCPMTNLELSENQITQNGNCTLCYRCVNLCPVKAISIFSKNKPTEQYTQFIEKIK